MTGKSLTPKVVYEDEHVLAIEKPSGLIVHPARHVSEDPARPPELTLVDWLIQHYPEVRNVGDDPALRPGIVHRLDKETSGVMVIPKSQDYFLYLKDLFARHVVKKTYYAVVSGVPKQDRGLIDAPIGIRNGTLKRSIRSTKMQKEAVTRYEIMRTFEAPIDGARSGMFSLLAVHPETGRTHQSRVHLASIGAPIVGDKLYGGKRQPPWATRLMLHAAIIEFPARDGHVIRIDSEPDWRLPG